MNITQFKKIIFSIIFCLSLQGTYKVYAKDTPLQEDKEKQEYAQEKQSNSYSPEEQAALKMFIEECFQAVKSQTEAIKYCLQEIEIIVNAEKIKLTSTTPSKAEFLAEIKAIKYLVQSIEDFYTTQMPQGDGMIHGTYFNYIILEYLLKTDIKKIKVDEFDQYIASKTQEFEKLLGSLESLEQIATMIQENDKQLEKLKKSCENIGLTIFNKWYRSFETKALPLTGKSALASLKDIVLWGGSAFFAYTMITYGLPKATPIWGTWTEYIKEEKKKTTDEVTAPVRANPITLNMTLDDHAYAHAKGARLAIAEEESTEPYTWTGIDGKIYRRLTVGEALPLKKFLGDTEEVSQSRQARTMTELKKLRENFGIYSYVEDAVYKHTNPFFNGALAILAYFTKESMQELYRTAKQAGEKFINYNLRGDAAPLKNSHEVPKAYFTDMIGGEHLERLAHELVDYLKNPTRYERQGIPPSTGYLLVGPPQTGKSYFAKALKTLIDQEFEDQPDHVKFFSVTADDVQWYGGFSRIFTLARKDSPCILFIDELDMYGARREKNDRNTQELLTSINGLETDPNKKVIVIAATNRPEELDVALKAKGRLGTIINFDLPSYECRKAYLEKQLLKKNIDLPRSMIETVAQETNGHTYNMIDEIIRHALRLATYETRLVTEHDFEVTLDREVRKIKPNVTMSAQEKELVAIYQAGQAAARHILQTEQQVVKITINSVDKAIKTKEGVGFISEQKGHQHENIDLLPQNHIKHTRLGYVFTMSKSNNPELMNDEDQEKELLALLAGSVALELLKNKKFSEFGKEDRAKILEVLEKKIAQGNPVTNKMRADAIEQKDALYQKVKQLLQKHTGFIKSITAELLKHTTLNKQQWEQLATSYRI